MSLIIEKLGKSFDNLVVFKNFGLEIPEGKITCILGPSGCGKTTLLNIVGGIEKADSGKLIGFESKRISYLFQEPRLIRWKTVWENVEFVIKDIFPKKDRNQLVSRYLEIMGLRDFDDYYPDKLSGGMIQRVAIARAFIFPADILIMDEPFKGLDLKLKMSIMNEFIKLWLEDKRTVIFVTHDIDEAIFLGDEICVLSKLPAKIIRRSTNDISKKERKFKDIRNSGVEREFFELITGV